MAVPKSLLYRDGSLAMTGPLDAPGILIGDRTPTSRDPRAPVDLYAHQTEADRDGTGNLNLLLLYPEYTFLASDPAKGNSFGVRCMPTVDGDGDPVAHYISDFHGFWESTSGTGSMIAVTGEVEIMLESTAGTDGIMVGVSGEIIGHHNTGTIAQADNLRAYSRQDAEGAYTNLHGLYILHEQAAGTTDTFYGVKVNAPAISGTGEITTAYGVYLNIKDAGTNWGIFSASDAPNYFGGRITADRGVIFTGGSHFEGTIHYNAADGLSIAAKTGTTYDLSLIATGGDWIARVPTGTQDLETVGALLTAPSTANRAGLRVPHGIAPTAPVDGDIWTNEFAIFVRIGGVTRQLATA